MWPSGAGVCLYLQRSQRPLVNPVFNVEQQVSQSPLHDRLCCSGAFWDRSRRLWVIWKQRSLHVYICVIHLCSKDADSNQALSSSDLKYYNKTKVHQIKRLKDLGSK